MRSILLGLNETSANIKASAIISKDGLVIAAAMPDDMNEDNIGGISAALYSAGSRSAWEFAGGIEQIIVHGSQGYVLMAHVGKENMLTVITKTHHELDPIFLELKRSAKKVAEYLSKLE